MSSNDESDGASEEERLRAGAIPSFSDDEEEIVAYLQLQLAVGRDFDEGAQQIKRFNPDPEFHERVDGVVRKLQYIARFIRHHAILGDTVAVEEQLGGWYPGEGRDDLFWPALRAHLLEQDGWRDAVESLDKSSRLVTSLLGNPHAAETSVRGLVVGYVQSGKTANFTATIAKAADKGYRLFIVLSGIHNSLRRQTQIRMDEHLKNLHPGRWAFLTDEHRDFGRGYPVQGLLDPGGASRTLAVVKKNQSRLKRLLEWLEEANKLGLLERCPVLVIDDEADQATVNVARNALVESSKIHYLIKQIVNTPPRCTYVGYTATPFANVLMNAKPEDTLYPRDFMAALPKPDGYFGSADIFNAELAEPDDELGTYDIVRFIDDDELETVTSHDEPLDPSDLPALVDAVRWFILASAARRARGQIAHSSMLVHTSARILDHDNMLQFLRGTLVPKLRAEWEGQGTRQEWMTLWSSEGVREPSERHELLPVHWWELEDHVATIFDELKIVMDNSRSVDRLMYGDDKLPVIAVGGNTLSRGLTLEGLVCSYFARNARTYDALLQMGRWFGYRRGYQDLPRVWTSTDLWENFRFLSIVEEDLRTEIKRYFEENLRPGQVAPRIRTHPSLSLVARNKLQFAVEGFASFGGRHPQTTYFARTNQPVIDSNILAARHFVQASNKEAAEETVGSNTVFHGVSWLSVRRFLESYSIHESSNMTRDLLLKYVEQQIDLGALQTWNVAVMSKMKGDDDATIDLGLAQPVPCLVRTRLRSEVDDSVASIGTLMSRPDRMVDLGGSGGRMTDHEMQKARDQSGRPLIALYALNKDSKVTKAREKHRRDLEAAGHLIAVGFSFPNDHPNTPFGGAVIQLGDEFLEAMENELGAASSADVEGDFVYEAAP